MWNTIMNTDWEINFTIVWNDLTNDLKVNNHVQENS